MEPMDTIAAAMTTNDARNAFGTLLQRHSGIVFNAGLARRGLPPVEE